MGNHRLPERIRLEELENAGQCEPAKKEKEWMDHDAEDSQVFGVTGDWSTAALDPGAWYNTVCEGSCRSICPRG